MNTSDLNSFEVNIKKNFKGWAKKTSIEEVKVIVEKLDRFAKNMGMWYMFFLKIFQAELLTLRDQTLLKLIFIFYITEGPISTAVNLVSFILMSIEHHDVWSEYRQKFISSYDELAEIPLSIRLKFLKEHGFEIFSKICPAEIRNAIAHNYFEIDSKGVVYIIKKGKKHPKTSEELSEVLNKIQQFLGTFEKAFQDIYVSPRPDLQDESVIKQILKTKALVEGWQKKIKEDKERWK